MGVYWNTHLRFLQNINESIEEIEEN
jgi:hypothetical protein